MHDTFVRTSTRTRLKGSRRAKRTHDDRVYCIQGLGLKVRIRVSVIWLFGNIGSGYKGYKDVGLECYRVCGAKP